VAASPRLRWAAATVAARPDERLLEVGCGQGVVVGLIAATLTTGHIVGLDRSAKMIDIARRTNAEHVAAGRASLVVGAVEEGPGDAGFGTEEPLAGSSFDTVLAVRVAAFWTRPAAVLPVTRRLLAPGGRLLLMFDAPAAAAADRALGQLRAALDEHGFRVDEVLGGAGTGVVARPV
jgi:SAM-dependent methyltransferase